MILHMLAQFVIDDDACRKSIFLQQVGIVLRELYTDTAEDIRAAVQTLSYLRRVVQGCPPDAILPVLSSLADGLSVWVGDEDEVLRIQDHNDVVSNINLRHRI